MDPLLSEWTNLLLRWFHIFTGILWIGSTWYFTWLDFRVREAAARAAPGEAPVVWMVHSGGFYRVEKLARPQVDPSRLHWFKWEALFTLISGLLLFGLVYWHGGLMTDPDVSSLTAVQAMGLSAGLLVLGWLVYDALFLSPLVANEWVAALLGYALVAALATWLFRAFAPRAVYLQIGAMSGTLMTLNVWVRILPAQRQLVAALQSGAAPDQRLADRAKLRSKHNTLLVVPVVAIMVSNHFPVATYGSDHALAVLLGLVAVGWAIGWRVRGHV